MDKWIEELIIKAKSFDRHYSDGNLLDHDPEINYGVGSPHVISLDGEFTIKQLTSLITHMKKYTKEE